MEGVGKIGGKLGRRSFLPVGKEVVSMRRGKSFNTYCTFNICLFFINETSGIRPTIPWISDSLKCLNLTFNIERKTREREGSQPTQPLLKTTCFKIRNMNKTLANHIQDQAHHSDVYLLELNEIQVFKLLIVEGINWF